MTRDLRAERFIDGRWGVVESAPPTPYDDCYTTGISGQVVCAFGGPLGHVRARWRVVLLRLSVQRTDSDGFTRWLLHTRRGSLRLHRYAASFGDDEGMHDHHWPFVTVVLRGGYDDITAGGVERLRAPAVRLRRATHRHRVVIHSDGALTLLLTGRRVRDRG